MKGVNIFLADGFEDVEALGTYDTLKRGGIDVQLVAIGDEPFVCSSHGITVGVENFLDDMDLGGRGTDHRDVMIFPGGMPGSKKLASCGKLVVAMQDHYAAGGTVAAICAAPGLVLSQLDIPAGTRFTCFDGFEKYLEAKGGVFDAVPAVRDSRIITGRSAGHALSFALEILAALKPEKVEEVRNALFLQTDAR